MAKTPKATAATASAATASAATASTTTAPDASGETIAWHNTAQMIDVQVNDGDDVPEAMALLPLSIMIGETIPDGDAVKRAAWRIKAMDGATEFGPFKNAALAINAALKAKFGATKFHDVGRAVQQITMPERQTDEKPAAAPELKWTEYANAAELVTLQTDASASATLFLSGETHMREGLRNLGRNIAQVAETLEKPAAFAAWVAAGSVDLRNVLSNRNDKSELIFMGRLPADWFDQQGEAISSAKAYQRNHNIDKNEIAGDMAAAVWGKKSDLPGVGVVQKLALEKLRDIASGPVTGKAMLAAHYLGAVDVGSDDGAILFLDMTEGVVTELKLSDGTAFVTPIVFGSGNRPNELVAAFCKALAAQAPEAKQAQEEKESNAKAASAVNPRVFPQYAVGEAALHIARILSSHDDWADVLDVLNGMADRAEKSDWSQVLSDTQSGIDADKAAALEQAAEEAADNAA
jgi:hypothetical protein